VFVFVVLFVVSPPQKERKLQVPCLPTVAQSAKAGNTVKK